MQHARDEESKSLDDIVARYAEIVDDGRPPVSHFLDAAAWSVPTVPTRSAEELCDTPGPGCAHTLADKCQDEAGVLSLVVPRLRADEAALVNLGSAFSLGRDDPQRRVELGGHERRTCPLRAQVPRRARRRGGGARRREARRRRRTTRSTCASPRTLATRLVKGKANLAAAAARVRAALAANTSQPLYVATDDVGAALRIVKAEHGAKLRACRW